MIPASHKTLASSSFSLFPYPFTMRRPLPANRQLAFRSLAHALLKYFADLDSSDPRCLGDLEGTKGGFEDGPYLSGCMEVFFCSMCIED